MKKWVLLFVFLTFPARAAEFFEVWPIQVVGKVVQWNYTFMFKRSAKAVAEPAHFVELACDRPILPSTNKPLLPVPAVCFSSESEARESAQKEADQFEKNAALLPIIVKVKPLKKP